MSYIQRPCRWLSYHCNRFLLPFLLWISEEFAGSGCPEEYRYMITQHTRIAALCPRLTVQNHLLKKINKLGSSNIKVVRTFPDLMLPVGLVWQTLYKARAARSWYYIPTAQKTSQKKKWNQWHNAEKHRCLQRELNGRDEIQLRYLNIVPFSCNPHPRWLQAFQFVQKWTMFHAAAHCFLLLSSRRNQHLFLRCTPCARYAPVD